jgi:threonyl-tRNA synthetase
VTNKSPEALESYRHSTAHLLAAAVTALFPKVQCGIGPPIEDGFYYDFIVERPFVPEDLEAIEAKMKDLASKDYVYERQLWPRQEAIDFFTKRGEPLKVQLIEEKTAGQPDVSVYTIKDKDTFLDFCVGPHVPSTGRLKAFKLTSTSNAYWKGDAKNAPMQRVYGTAFFSQKELDEHLARLEEAKKRDHRKVGKELGLFTFHQWAPGATFWLPKGHDALQHAVELHARCVDSRRLPGSESADRVQQGAVADVRSLGLLPGQHVPREVVDGEEMGLKPMNCPGHFLLFGSEMRSYKDLPLRFHEQTPLHRNEASGTLSGLTRVRQFSQDDGHCFVMQEQIASEVEALIKLVSGSMATSGLSYAAKLSTRPEKFLGEVATWDDAEAALRRALDSSQQAYTLNAGDGTFYGPRSTSTSRTRSAGSGSARRFSSTTRCPSAST